MSLWVIEWPNLSHSSSPSLPFPSPPSLSSPCPFFLASLSPQNHRFCSISAPPPHLVHLPCCSYRNKGDVDSTLSSRKPWVKIKLSPLKVFPPHCSGMFHRDRKPANTKWKKHWDLETRYAGPAALWAHIRGFKIGLLEVQALPHQQNKPAWTKLPVHSKTLFWNNLLTQLNTNLELVIYPSFQGSYWTQYVSGLESLLAGSPSQWKLYPWLFEEIFIVTLLWSMLSNKLFLYHHLGN